MTALREIASPSVVNTPSGVLAPEAPDVAYLPPLTAQEMALLTEHEKTVAMGAQVFVAVGEALMEIQARKLYRADFGSFEAYLEARWPKLKLRRAYQYINAAMVVNNLYTLGSEWHPSKEGPARELTGLTEEDLRIIADVAKEMSVTGEPTAADLRGFVAVLREIRATGAVDDGTGEQIPVSRATTQHLKAAVIEEVYERTQRQRQHIIDGSAWQRVDTLVVTTDAGLQAALEAVTNAFYASGKTKVSYYIEKGEAS